MNKVTEIHKSDLYGIVIETGCSTATSRKLMDINGASKTVLFGFQPYSKELEEAIYGDFPRSVSMEFIESVLNKKGEIFPLPEKLTNKINFVIGSSWQLNNDAEPLQTPHGWIGLLDIKRNVKYYLHFTFNRNICQSYIDFNKGIPSKIYQETRDMLIDSIGDIGINLIHTILSGDIKEFDLNNIVNSQYISLDMAYIQEADNEPKLNVNFLVSVLEKYKGDYFLAFKDNQPIRLEDFMRNDKEFIIQKGSFNPVHKGHLEIMELSKKVHNCTQAFLISTFRYDKPHISSDELVDRIEQINKEGYPLIICKNIYYYNTFAMLRNWTYGKRFYFTVGMDTLLRIHKTDVEDVEKWNTNSGGKNALMRITVRGHIEKIIRSYPNFKFLVFERKGYNRNEDLKLYDAMCEYNTEYKDSGISSTSIRKKQEREQ